MVASKGVQNLATRTGHFKDYFAIEEDLQILEEASTVDQDTSVTSN